MRVKYFTIHPRGFTNEYDTVKVETKEEENLLNDWYYNKSGENCRMYRRTLKELRHMAAEERWRRKVDHAFSGYCSPWNPISVQEFLNPTYYY